MADVSANGYTPSDQESKQPWQPLSMRARPAPVTRLNRKVVGALGVVVIAGIAWAISTGLKPPAPPAPRVESTQTVRPQPPEQLNNLPQGYGDIIRPAPPAPVVPLTPTPLMTTPPAAPSPSAQPVPPVSQGPTPEQVAAAERRRKAQEEAEKARQQAAEERAKARMSGLFFASTQTVDAHQPPLGSQLVAGAATPQGGPYPPGQRLLEREFAGQAEKRQFLERAGQQDKDVVPHLVQAPVSPYEVKAGTVIPAVLLTGIHSDLPGQLIAQVREPVYDTATGTYLLIPQGTRILGTYDSAVVHGQNRVLAVWTRLIFPDGTSLRLAGMPGVDLAGYAGFKDRVNNHFGALLGSVVLSSILGIGARLPFGSVEENRFFPSLGQEFAEQAASNINRAGQSIVQRQLQQQPTIEIRPGFAINVFVNADLVLQPAPGP